MFTRIHDWTPKTPPRYYFLEDFEAASPRWCPGCGDHAVLNAVLRLARDEQLSPENTVFVSGIGCSSRFPHYLKTYGFHGLHGRAFPVATGVRSRRPDLNVFVVTGDGDCCAIGAGHWIHAIRYNMNLTVLMLDNNVYGLTKNQTSPTTRKAVKSNTHPGGSVLDPLDPIAVTLGITNASFVAQAPDWNPPYLYAAIQAAFRHRGTSFLRIFQRCPHFSAHAFEEPQKDRSRVLLMTHPKGIGADEAVRRTFPNQIEHDPGDLAGAYEIAHRRDVYPIGLFYRNEQADRYDEIAARGLQMDPATRFERVQEALDSFLI